MNQVQESNSKHVSGGIQMEERKEPTFVRFDKPGQMVCGKLLRVDRVTVDEGRSMASRYTLQEGAISGGAFVASGELVAFLGVYLIDASLRPQDVGHFLEIRYEGEDRDVRRGDNAMKRFKIRVSRQVVEESEIPF